MLIECIIKRNGGSHVSLGSETYHFRPGQNGAHVAEVEDPEHVQRLLLIAEGFREAEAQEDSGGSEEAHVAKPRGRPRKQPAQSDEGD